MQAKQKDEAITFMRKQAKKEKEENYDKNKTYETITCRQTNNPRDMQTKPSGNIDAI